MDSIRFVNRYSSASLFCENMVIKVAINGYGTIGKRVADAVDAQDDMEIVGVTKTRPAFGCDLAVRKGYQFFAPMMTKKKSTHSLAQGMTVTAV